MINLKRLPNQQRNETTQLFLRRHWIELAQIGLYLLILIAVPILLITMIRLAGNDPLTHEIWGPLISVFFASYLFIVLTIVMTQFTDYYLDTWIVTNERIINIEQHGLFSRIVSELHLNQVQDVTSETHGFLATMLSYGDVYIQTAGTRERFNFKGIDNPDDVKRTITKLVHEDKIRHGDASQPGMLNKLDPNDEPIVESKE